MTAYRDVIDAQLDDVVITAMLVEVRANPFIYDVPAWVAATCPLAYEQETLWEFLNAWATDFMGSLATDKKGKLLFWINPYGNSMALDPYTEADYKLT